jgi:quercetin dioxygenase-like cupin family protein
MYIRTQSAPVPTAILGIAHTTLAGSDDGLKHLSLWRQSMAPGACTPPHSHDCEEVVMCEAGHGEVHIDGVVHAFGPGQMLLLPPGLPHQIFATSDEPLVTLAVFPRTPVPVALPDGTLLELPWRS